MEIAKALPPKKYADALKHSTTPEFKKKLQASIQRIRSWRNAPGVAQELKPYLYLGYGKDSMATAIVMKKAGVDFTALIIDNQADLPGHELVVPEFHRFLNGSNSMEAVLCQTDDRYIDIIYYWLVWGNSYGLKVKDKPLNFFEWGAVGNQIGWEAVTQFENSTDDGIPGVMRVWGNRASEGMERHYEQQKHGMFYLVGKADDPYSYWRCLPISDWRDIDVWALLASEGCPVSEIYSKHALPMGGGKKAFPRTIFWCGPEIWNPSYYKWLGYYYPALLKEAIDFFPEIKAKFVTGASIRA